jgi:hypothetical protein
MSHAVLLETLDTGGIWSVARGLARNLATYRGHLMAFDQVRFMEELVEPNRLRDRIRRWAEEGTRAGALPSRTGALLETLLFRGELPRGEVGTVLGVVDRHARRIVSALIDQGVLASASARGSLTLTFPAALASRWMPGLFPASPD